MEFNSIDLFFSLKQYIKNKPYKWNIAVFARSSNSGIIYDFEKYDGKRQTNRTLPRVQEVTLILYSVKLAEQ